MRKKNYKVYQFFIAFLVFFFCVPSSLTGTCLDHEIPYPLPGRLGAEFCYTEMGKTKIFFYMVPRKEEISRQLIHSINSNSIKITTDITTPPCPVSEISLMITKFQDGIMSQNTEEDSDIQVMVDPIGEAIFNNYAREVVQIAESIFGFTVTGFSKDLSLIANHDAVKIHKDYFSQQYAYLSSLHPPIPKYYLFQDLTLIDWAMAKSSCSGTLLQDRESGDRFLMIMFPGEVFGAIYTEPIVDKGPMVVPTFPGPVSFPFHTALAPFDFFGCCNTGSWKGKRISVTTRGIIREDAIQRATEKAIYLPLNRPSIHYDEKDYLTRIYPNGVIVKNIYTIPLNRPKKCLLHEDKENVTILEDKSEVYLKVADWIKDELNIVQNLKGIFHLTKHDGGFSRLSHILPHVPDNGIIVIMNRSTFPPGYKHFILAEDYTNQKCPWFQLYWLPQSGIMQIPASLYNSFLLTPVEEILFRDEIADRLNTEASVLNSKMTINIDVFIFA